MEAHSCALCFRLDALNSLLNSKLFSLAPAAKRRPFCGMISRRFWFVVAALLLATTAAQAAGKKSESSAYKGAITIDAATGKVLFEDNADLVSPPASVTKLMTFLIVHDRIKAGLLALDTPVKIVAEDAKLGGTQVWLDPRETIKVEDLIFAMMIRSANDASHALARTAGGSRDAFVEMMNAKTRELGMTNTRFRSPHGLPSKSRKPDEGDLTSPRDLAILSQALIQQTDVLNYTSVRRRAFRDDPSEQVVMDSHNHLLRKVDGCDGLKTGFTQSAGYCISATAQRDGRRVIVVVMGSPTHQARDVRAIELIEKGLALLPPGSPVFSASPVSPIGPAAPAPKTGATPNRSSVTPVGPPSSVSSGPAAPSAEKEAPLPTVTFPNLKRK